MKAVIRVAITILMLTAEVAGSIICFSNIYKSPCEVLLFWCVATIAAIMMWCLLIDVFKEEE